MDIKGYERIIEQLYAIVEEVEDDICCHCAYLRICPKDVYALDDRCFIRKDAEIALREDY